MASTSAQVASDSSPSNFGLPYDVFLSFRGEDTRYNFTDHLYTALIKSGITTFRDDRLTRGEKIQPELLEAIEKSRSSIIVFSKNYAESRWCLKELVKIMECRQKFGQIVLPIFYHVNPCEVRQQTGSFAEAFTNHENKWKNKVKRWREACTEAADLSGWHVNGGFESEFIKKIIDVCKRLNDKCLYVGKNLVGMDSHLRRLSSKLKILSNDDVRIVGIWGAGGIGKTTMAKAIYNQIAHEFDCVSFLENVKEIHKVRGLHDLQKQLLHDITGENHYIGNTSHGAQVIQNILRSRKALIVFDDIDDDLKLFEYLVGVSHWYGRGSRVLITTRDRNLLHKIDDLYEIKGLNLEDALKLFSLYAFQKKFPEEDYKILSFDVIHYCKGLPLALKVLGSLLRGKPTSEWESELHKLKNIPNAKIQDVLKISYDELDRIEQAIFLDIACFFKGEDRNFVSKILDGCEMYGESGIGSLEAKCLITFSNNMIYMHDLMQEVGWEIIRKQHPKDPNKWSRLWNPDDIYRAFMSEEGMKNVETLSLDLSRSTETWFTKEVFTAMKIRFAEMKKLRLLKVYYNDDVMRKEYKISLPEGFEFPGELRYLHWEGLEALPTNFDPDNLVAINLKFSYMKKLWKRNKNHEKLKFVDVSHSQQLTKIPELSRMPNLERLNIEGCTSFCKFHSSVGAFPEMKFLKELVLSETGVEELPSCIQYLTYLEILDLSGCEKFQQLPDSFAKMRRLWAIHLYETRIKELPSSIGYLESLEILNLSYCSHLEKFPEMVETKCLKELYLEGTSIKELPRSIGYLESLRTIYLSDCSKFVKFPEMVEMKCLEGLFLDGTPIKELPSSIGYLESLKTIDLTHCSKIEKFPEMVKTKCLKELLLEGTSIKELPSSIGYLEYLETIDLSCCSKFEKLPEMVKTKCLKNLLLEGTSMKELPSSIGYLESLETIDLSDCSKFVKFPEMMETKCLEDLFLSRSSIKELSSSIGYLESLKTIYVKQCSNFEKFPEMVKTKWLRELSLEGTSIKELPSSIGYLESLEIISLKDCSKFEKFPEMLKTECLRELSLEGTSIKELPSSIGYLESLEIISLKDCSNFEKFPEMVKTKCLKELRLEGTSIQELPSSIGYLESLETISLSNCSKFEKLPEMVKAKCLKELKLDGTAIMELPSSIGYLESLKTINLRNCSKFKKFPEIQAGNLKCLAILDLEGTAIEELPNCIGCLKALEMLNVGGCSNLKKIPKMQRNMGRLSQLDISGTAIKELPNSIAHLKGLGHLNLKNCKRLKSLPGSMCKLKSIKKFYLNGCSNLDVDGFWKIIEEMEQLEVLECAEMPAITEVPSSIGRLKYLWTLRLSHCTNLVTLPNSLRTLQFRFGKLDLSGCNLMEGAIPTDLWSLSSLWTLNLSRNNIRTIPTGIIQLSLLKFLFVNHCPILEQIPELPSGLKVIQVHSCPRLKALLCDPTKDLLWYSLLNAFELNVQELRCEEVRGIFDYNTQAFVPPTRGKTGIPKWVKDKSMGCEVSIELPNKWYKDDTFLGFAFFFTFVSLPYYECEFGISQLGDQFITVIHGADISEIHDLYEGWLGALGLFFFPQNSIPNQYRSKRWKYFKACITRNTEIKSCGIHLIYAKAQYDHKKRSRNNDINPAEEAKSHSGHKRSRHVF